MKVDGYYLHTQVRFGCFVNYTIHWCNLRQFQAKDRADSQNYAEKTHLLKVLKTEARILQFT